MNCYCQSGLNFIACCGRYILAGNTAAQPEILMRSRFSAYVLAKSNTAPAEIEAGESSAVAVAAAPQQLPQPTRQQQALDYIAGTYHPSLQSNTALAEIQAFAQAVQFINLHILAASVPVMIQRDDLAVSEFTLTPLVAPDLTPSDLPLQAKVGLPPCPIPDLPAALPADTQGVGYVHFKVQFLQADKLHLLEEISRFVFCQQRWWYLDGQLFDHLPMKITRNDPCPCGSGSKFKNCRDHRLPGTLSTRS